MAPAPPRRRPPLGLLLTGAVALLAVGLAAERVAWLDEFRLLMQRLPSQFPSSRAVPPEELTRPGALLSVYVPEDGLRGPEHGLLVHPTEVGREWERPGAVSYFEDGRLQFASNVGVRIHGGKSRTGSPVQSFRLYFRREYGAVQFRSGSLFGGRGDPLTRLVAHNDLRIDRRSRWWHLINPLAFDIARRVGALAPETEPAGFVLNGVPQGLYVLTEHVRSPFLKARFGHERFQRADEPLRARWARLVVRRETFTMADARTMNDAPWLDVESLSRWFVSVVFSGTTDAFQAVMFRDRTRPDARWFWVNWDMDHSFMDLYGRGSRPSRQDTFQTTLRSGAFESRVLRRLIADDPVYRRYLADLFLDALNHQLTPVFLEERYAHYAEIAGRFGLQSEPYLADLARFLEERPAFVRETLVRTLDLEPLRRVRVTNTAGLPLTIDGHPVRAGYDGWHLPGSEVRLAAARPGDAVTWRVNGRPLDLPELWHRVGDRNRIEARPASP